MPSDRVNYGDAPCVLTVYYLASARWRNVVLLVASIVFYAWGDFDYLGILIGIVIVNYFGALLLDGTKNLGPFVRKFLVGMFVVADLAMLFYFKYFDFVIGNVAALFGVDYVLRGVVMPLGISFYTFQSISYLVDVYRREIPAQRNLLSLALFVSYFPQLVAGPILKYHDVYAEIEARRETLDHFAYGARRFIMGLAKKVLVANTMGGVADAVFGDAVANLGSLTAWSGAVAYSLQIYFDFSGYSDMAIGLGAMFGFHFLENFNYPYISKSITEFWRRWHISLSTWFKEYLYIPLGGNRVSRVRNLLNLCVVFLVTGFWHGAEWSFVAWGAFHGLFILLEKMTQWHKIENGRGTVMFHHAYLLLVVMVGWVFFRSPTLSYALDFLMNMFGLAETAPTHSTEFYWSNWSASMLFVALPLAFGAFRGVHGKLASHRVLQVLFDVWLLALLFLSMVFLAGSTYNPFIYFRF